MSKTEKEKAKTGREIYWEIQESKGFNIADALLDKEYFSTEIVEKMVEDHQEEISNRDKIIQAHEEENASLNKLVDEKDNYIAVLKQKNDDHQKELGHCHFLNYQYIERKKDLENLLERVRQLLNSIVWLDKEDVKTKVEQLRNTLGEGKTESKNEGEKEH